MDVISIHVPKTAGSAFGSLLAKIYGEPRVFRDYDDRPMDPFSPCNGDRASWRSSASARIRSIGPEIRAIHGHFNIEKYAEHFPEARRIAWVRHPVSWVISLYYFWKNVPTNANPLIRRLHSEGLSLETFAQDPIVRNSVSRIFLRGASIESLAFVGIQEHFEADFEELASLMSWPKPAVGLVNLSPETGYADRVREIREDRRLVDRLAALNEEDMALYDAALRLRAERLGVKPLGPLRGRRSDADPSSASKGAVVHSQA